MHPEVEQLRPKLKEILYDCAVEIRATKAALHLFDAESRYELVAEYGFRGSIRQTADAHDPLIDICARGRSAFFVNGLAAEPRLAELMFESSSDRLLAAPLYLRGQLVGVIDMRDKAAREPFDRSDLPKAQAIAERMIELFAGRNLFGQRFLSISDPTELPGERLQPAAAPPDAPRVVSRLPDARASAPPRAAVPATAPIPAARRRQSTEPRTTPVPSLATLILEARTSAAGLGTGAAQPELDESDLSAVRDVLRSILLIPGALVASFSAFGHRGGVQEIVARSAVTEEATAFIQSKLTAWLRRRGEEVGPLTVSSSSVNGGGGVAIRGADLQKVFTAPVAAGPLRGLYLTIGFGENPDRTAHELLATLHAHLQLVLEHALQQRTLSVLRRSVAAKLIEPDLQRFPELRRHTTAVSSLAESFARYLGLPAVDVENAALLALVHDAGMRLLDYQRLYRKSDLTPEEIGFLREHPTVGAAIVEPLLGGELAYAVLCHHERVDGRGYPNEIEGDQIPFLARLVQICDAFVAMTDAETYQPPESPEAALATIAGAAGTQFDRELAARFVEMMQRTAGRVTAR